MPKKDMELEGTLRAFSLPDILQFLSMGKMTGILSIWREAYNISLTVKEGKIVNSSTLDRPCKLGDMLVYRGFIKRRDLEEVLNAQQGLDRGKLVGQILVERDIISKQTLRDALKLQLEEEIWELFLWKDGQFKFEQKLDVDTSNIVVEIDIEPLLIEGSRRQDEWGKISQNIPDEDVVLTVVAPENSTELGPALNESEWSVLSLVNGFYEVGSIVVRCGLDKFETYRILNTFIMAGLLRQKPFNQVEKELLQQSDMPPGIPSLTNVRSAEPQPQETSGAARYSKKGIASLFSRGKQVVKESPPTTIRLDFISPLGALAFFINSFYETLIKTEGFITSRGDDSDLLCIMWRSLLMRHPKADIIIVTYGRLNVKIMERIIQMQNGISRAVNECYDESLALLSGMTKKMHQIGLERLGEKSISRIATGILNDFSANIHYKHDEKFDFRSWVEELVKI